MWILERKRKIIVLYMEELVLWEMVVWGMKVVEYEELFFLKYTLVFFRV